MENDIFIDFLYLFFAFIPACIWMVFYFKKDLHPEPKEMILRVFTFGFLSACVAALIEISVLNVVSNNSLIVIILESFLLIAFIEELVKYLVVRIYIFNSPELDEPLDVMLYMVISALGFATLENLILFFGVNSPYAVDAALGFVFWRFLGAVFLHTLTSGAFGFFIALSFYFKKNKKIISLCGFIIAVIFHGLYNLVINEFSGLNQYLILASIIIVLLIFTTYGFIRLRKMKSICKI